MDEAHLLPLALKIFGEHHFVQSGRYIAVKKNVKSKSATLAKRLEFDSYYSFILTDFFEGLHYGHYPRRCEICGKYFLMQSARRQKYCPYGIAPELYRGRKMRRMIRLQQYITAVVLLSVPSAAEVQLKQSLPIPQSGLPRSINCGRRRMTYTQKRNTEKI